MFIPFRAKNPPESFPYATVALITVNVIAFALTADWTSGISRDIVERYAETATHHGFFLSLASMFLHANVFHLLGNMWFLYLFGFAVEGRLKSFKFLLLYFAAGLFGDWLEYATVGIGGIGASGAVMGVMGAAMYMFPFAQIEYLYLWITYRGVFSGRAALPMYGIAAIYLAIDIFYQIFEFTHSVAHYAHIGGMLGGVLVCALMRATRDSQVIAKVKAELVNNCDMGVLSGSAVEEMVQPSPGDTAMILKYTRWALETDRLSESCRVAFKAFLPRIIKHQPALEVGMALLGMYRIGEFQDPACLAQVAFLVDDEGDAHTALRLFDAATKIYGVNVMVMEQALFRSALIYETKLHEPEKARDLYVRLMREIPGGPKAESARSRLKEMVASGVITVKTPTPEFVDPN